MRSAEGRDALLHLLLLAMIGAGAWLVAALLLVFEDGALAKFREWGRVEVDPHEAHRAERGRVARGRPGVQRQRRR